MEPDKSLRTLFNGALEQDNPAGRARFLDEACGTDPALRERVEKLLCAHDDAGGFFSEPSKAPSNSVAHMQTITVPLTEKPGDTIGRYKLLQQIGEGGCGVVYMAEQEEPVRRRVALKVIKLGMDTKQVIARFEAERQALALMDHANIARVLDAGTTDTGRPYFVMELVRGIRITDYCDQNNLPTEARLGLFSQVCQAIQHAHQKGIIHRDIKPSNVLVTLHDGVPVAKVIDFGIARATTGQRLTDKTIFTAFEQFIGTPAYMSPEQAEMSGLDIDTRSDIYALGVLLYELLTGQTPFDAKDLLASGLDAMRRTIREQEPPRPSTRLSTMLAADLTTVAKHHQADSTKLTHAISGDLDWIVMKALEKDRTRRYETASGLALDIQRHLNNEPVTARPASNLYRFRKLVRRNKLAFAAAGAVAAALVIGILASTWQAVRATRAEHEQSRLRAEAQENANAAQTEASKSNQVAEFLKDMLKGVAPSVALGRDTKMLREILDKTAERVGKNLKDQPDVEADLRSVIGNVYLQLGDYEKAGAMHGEALALRRKLYGNDHPKSATSLNNLANVLRDQGKLGEAETMHREALAFRRKLFGYQHRDIAQSLNNLANVLYHQDKPAEAETLHREAMAMYRKLYGNEHPDVAASLNNLANVLMKNDKKAEGEAMRREALAMYRKLFGNEHPDVAMAIHNLANELRDQGKLTEAEIMLREALAMRRKLLGYDHPDVAGSLHELAATLWRMGKLAEAESMYREALATRSKLLGDAHPQTSTSRIDLANLLHEQGKLAEAEPLYREILETARKSATSDAPGLESCIYDLAENLRSQRKYAEAEPLNREYLRSRQARLAAGHGDVLSAAEGVARLLSDWVWAECGSKSKIQNPGSEVTVRAREAERLMRESLAVRLRGGNSNHWRTGDTRSRLGAALVAVAVADLALAKEVRLATLAEAESYLLKGNEALLASDEATTDKKREALTRIVHLYEAWDKPGKVAEWQQKLADFDKVTSLEKLAAKMLHQGKPAEAESLYREALSMWRKLWGNEHLVVVASLKNLANMFRDQGKLAEAEPLYREAMEIAGKSAATDPLEFEARLNESAENLYRQSKYAEGEPLYRQAIESRQARLGTEHEDVLLLTASLARLLADWAWTERGSISEVRNVKPEIAGRAREAERLLRDCLAIRLRGPLASHWRTDEIRSRLGAALLAVAVTDPALTSEARVAKFTESESLLLGSNEALQQNEKAEKKYKRDALIRLVRLYEAREKPDKAAEWQKKLDDFDKAAAKPETGTGADTPGP